MTTRLSTPARHLCFYLVLGTVLGLVTVPSIVVPQATCEPGVLLVRFAPDVVGFGSVDYGHNAFSATLSDAEFSAQHQELRSVFQQLKAASFETVAPGWRHLTEQDLYDRHGNRVDLVDFTDVYRVTFDGNDVPSVDVLRDVLMSEDGILHAECEQYGYLFSTPNDTYFEDQWALDNTAQWDSCDTYFDINAIEAWDVWDTTGTRIGILDQGIFDIHQDLRDYIDRDLSRSFVPDKEWYQVGIGETHGTSVAGIAAAGTNNGKGVAGVANMFGDSVIVALRVTGPAFGGGGPDSVPPRMCRALDYVTTSPVYPKVLVANYSGGLFNYKNCFSYSTVLRDACRNAFLKDISLVVAAGNDTTVCSGSESPCGSDSCFTYPAAFDDYCLAVTAINCEGELAVSKQQRGSFLDLAAPGRHVLTTIFESQSDTTSYGFFNKTSSAAPHVSGAIALLLGRDPTLTNEDCAHLLEVASVPVGSKSSVEVGHGLMKVDSALAAVTYPGAVIRDSVFADEYDLELIDQREQWFRNLSGAAAAMAETWQLLWVEVYELEVDAFLWDDNYASIDTVWIRGKFSEGAKNLADPPKYDAMAHAGYAELADYDHGNEKATFRTYVYKLFDEEEGDSLGWFPQDPAEDIRIDYSVLLRFAVGQKSGPELTQIQRFQPERLPSVDGAVLRLGLRAPGRYTINVFDVTGRLVRRLTSGTRLGPGEHRFVWDGRDNRGNRSAAGLYWASLRNVETRSQLSTTRLMLLR